MPQDVKLDPGQKVSDPAWKAIGRVLEGAKSRNLVQIQVGCWKANFEVKLRKVGVPLLAAAVGEALVAGHGARSARPRGEE